VVEWSFSSPAVSSQFGEKDDWLYKVIQTSDKGIVSVGFIGRSQDARRYPVILKYDPMRRTILWENSFPSLDVVDGFGTILLDVFEFDDGGGPAYYAVGSVNGNNQRLLVAKVDPSTGQSFSGYPKVIYLSTMDSIIARGFAMRPIVNGETFEGFMIAATIVEAGIEKGALVKLNTDGTLDTGFGSGGYAAFTFSGYAGARFRNFRPVPGSGDSISGYAVTGWVSNPITGGQDQDILVMYVDADGASNWHNIITMTELVNEGYEDGSAQVPYCPGTGQRNRGFDVEIDPDGGIVESNNSVILNCRRSVHFAPYERKYTAGQFTLFVNNRSIFSNTAFQCDDFMADPFYYSVAYNTRLGVNTHVSMWHVRGVRFPDCTWTSTTELPQALRGNGIVSDDASYFVTYTGETPNFVNLHRGILARSAFDQLKKITVRGNRFDNVPFGIQTVNGAFHDIAGNYWTDIPLSFDPDQPASYGIRLDGSTNFTVSGNLLTAAEPATAAFGIIADNTLGLPSSIKGNIFTDLRIGNQTQRNNSGLQIGCNQYEGARYAWSVNPESPQAGALPDQGECDASLQQAGNIFLDPACPSPGLPESHIYSSIEFKYSHRPITDETPTCYSTVVDIDNCGLNSNSETCVVLPPCNPCDPEELEDLMNEASTDKERWFYLGLLANLLIDEEGLDQAAHYIGDEPSAIYDKLKVQAWLSAGRYSEAEDALEDVPSADTAFHELYGLFITLGDEGRNLRQLTATEEQLLWDIADGHSPESNIARAALENIRDTVFYRHTEEIETSNLEQFTPPMPPSQHMVSDERSFSLSPNPAREELVLRYHSDPEALQGQVELFDAFGRQVLRARLDPGAAETRLSIAGLPSGLYYCTLAIEGQSPKTKPFLIIR
jgi:hypothetical protein